ncbi:MAG: restriction endonuclease subunit S [Methanosphaera sp.]|nr:restriction endonuclease subunit S [Methanosphaera sp.]
MSYSKYECYYDTSIEYIEQIPNSWKITRNKNLFIKNKNIVGQIWKKYPILSLTKEGVIIKDIEKNEGKMPSDFGTYQIIDPNNLLLCLFDIDVTPRCVGYINNKGIVSPAYSHIKPIKKLNMKYYYYWYLMLDNTKELLHLSKNLRNSISNENFMDLYLVEPPLDEQEQISKYLDTKTTKIQKTITKNKQLITLLKEKRTTLINQTVTKGLNPDVPMKESEIKWIGKIPEHWKISRLKFYCICNNSSLGDDTPAEYEFNYVDIGSVSLENGIEKYEQMNFDNAPSRARRIVKENDVIISTVRTYLKAIATIQKEENTIVSTGFAVLTPKNINYKFLGYFVKSEYFTETVNSKSVGVRYPAINSSELINIEIAVPPEKEQGKISEYLDEKCDKINKTIEKIERNIELLEEYKESLIHHVVTGKIDVRGVEL